MYNISSLILEVTRRCNMKCEHCLRGCAENEDMKFEVLEALEENVNYIGSATFSGGEPTLNPEIIIEYTNLFKEITSDFFMATNGTIYSEQIMSALVELYAHSDEQDLCCLAVSRDQFRDPVNREILNRYKAFSFFNDEYKSQPIQYIIDSGLAKENNIGNRESHYQSLKIDDDTIEMLYINVFGDVLTDCETSYDNQQSLSIGNILEESLEKIIEREISRMNDLVA